MADVSLYDRLHEAYLRCPFSDRKYLPRDVIDREITIAVVREEADLGYNSKKICEDVVQRAKNVFAILSIIGEPDAIEGLIKDGVCDVELPLLRRENDPKAKVLVSHDGRKEFRCFEKWKSRVRIGDFLERQWIVLAPIVDISRRHMKVDSMCALPLLTNDPVGHSPASVVSKCEVHWAHQEGLLVSEDHPVLMAGGN